MQIRKATIADKAGIVKMRIALQQHLEQSNPDIWQITKAGRQKLIQDVTNMLSEEQSLVLVAEDNNTILGFANGRITHRTEYSPPTVGFITMIFVNENYRRRGIGTQLIYELCHFFESAKIHNISVRYVLGNTEAEAFWQHLGFKPIIHTARNNLETLQQCVQNNKPLNSD
jgi:ribosomal protein S18 acetylase RimI-like enzyme